MPGVQDTVQRCGGSTCGVRTPYTHLRPAHAPAPHQAVQLRKHTAIPAQRYDQEPVPRQARTEASERVENSTADASAQSRRRVLLTAAAAAGTASLAPGVALALEAAGVGPTVLAAPPSTKSANAAALGFAGRVEEFTLPNGLHFIVLPRNVAPVVGTHILANVGAYQEEDGATGLAHLLEHMAFKGTRRVGAKDWTREAPLLDALDEVFYELRDAREEAAQGRPGAAERSAQLDLRLRAMSEQAAELVVPNAYGATLTRAGAVGLNASTSHDVTRYYASLPSNKLELWFALEAERFQAPVFRELYSEKRVIDEERRLRVDAAPLGRFEQDFAARALPNNYRRPVIGTQPDFDKFGRREVVDFFARHYGPRSLTIAVVGDVTVEQVRNLAEKYWGGWEGAVGARPSTTTPSRVPILIDGRPYVASSALTRDASAGWGHASTGLLLGGTLAMHAAPAAGLYGVAAAWGGVGEAAAATRVWRGDVVLPTGPWPTLRTGLGGATMTSAVHALQEACGVDSQCFASSAVGGPLVFMGFQRPSMISKEGPVIQVIGDILAGGRTSRLTRNLVLQRQALRGVRVLSSYPGDKYPGMCLLVGVPQQGQSPEAAARLLSQELDAFLNEGPDPRELLAVQRSTRTSVLASALSNGTMASLLATYHALTGSWRGLEAELDQLAELKPRDVQDVAQSLLQPRTAFRGLVYPAAPTAGLPFA